MNQTRYNLKNNNVESTLFKVRGVNSKDRGMNAQ